MKLMSHQNLAFKSRRRYCAFQMTRVTFGQDELQICHSTSSIMTIQSRRANSNLMINIIMVLVVVAVAKALRSFPCNPCDMAVLTLPLLQRCRLFLCLNQCWTQSWLGHFLINALGEDNQEEAKSYHSQHKNLTRCHQYLNGVMKHQH